MIITSFIQSIDQAEFLRYERLLPLPVCTGIQGLAHIPGVIDMEMILRCELAVVEAGGGG